MFQLVFMVRCKAKTTTLLGGSCIAVHFENSYVFLFGQESEPKNIKAIICWILRHSFIVSF